MIKAFKIGFGLTAGFAAAVFFVLVVLMAIAEACEQPEPVVGPIHQIHPAFLDLARERLASE